MKTNIFTLLALMVFASLASCKKDEKPGEIVTPLTNEQQLAKKWKLTGLVNISDQQKYVNSILEIKADKTYENIGNDQLRETAGKWSVIQDSLLLDSGIFASDDALRLKITLLNETTLKLSEHYTKGGKDAVLEYHYTAK